MYKICQTEQSFKRQRELENGLLRLMLKQRYEDITVSDLCDYLQIPRKSFYRYFSSKDGALFALLDHTMMDFQLGEHTGISGSAPGDLDRYFAFWYENRDILEALERSSMSGILVQRATNFALQERMMPRYMMSWDPSFQGAAMSFTICGLMSMVIHWHQMGYLLSPAEMTKVATTLLTRPCCPHNNIPVFEKSAKTGAYYTDLCRTARNCAVCGQASLAAKVRGLTPYSALKAR